MKVAIIGAGLTGLTLAYRLTSQRHRVIVFEKSQSAGGLAAGFKNNQWQWYLDNYFHHLFTSDKSARKLIDEIGLEGKLVFNQAKTSIYFNNKISRFDSGLSVLRFPHLTPLQKLKTGLTTFYLKNTDDWSGFEKITAEKWLTKHYGPKAYQTLWLPLLRAKFGKQASQISMVWFWGRIKKRSQRLGYLDGGFQTLANQLVKKIQMNGGQFEFNHEIKSDQIFKQLRIDRVVFTTPVSIFLKIMAGRLPFDYQKRLSKLKMVGAVNLILILKEKFLKENTYWLNVNQSGFPFVAVVEHTNFVNPKHYHNQHILYVGGYYPQTHRYFKMKKEAIFKDFFPCLKKINPQFKVAGVQGCEVNKNLFAQPVVPVNYSELVPKIKTPVKNVYLANMQTIYPWDRGLNYAVELGEYVADKIN